MCNHNEALSHKSLGALNIRACRMMYSMKLQCINWSNHKNVHCMRLHYALRHHICILASWTNHVLMSQQKAIKPRTQDSQRKMLYEMNEGSLVDNWNTRNLSCRRFNSMLESLRIQASNRNISKISFLCSSCLQENLHSFHDNRSN